MKKLFALMLAIVMIMTCTAAMADRLADIQQNGKLVVATSPDWPPYEYIDDEGNVTGTDVLMAKWMAEQLGVELELQEMAFDACLAAVAMGDVDMVVAGLTYDEERTNAMDLTGIYWNEGDQGLLVKKGTGAGYNSAEAFNGKVVAAQNGTNQQIMVEEQLTGA
ncbi:MAG: transporter substrate-binding domain-containing protein, partial [Clostridia bacterium]|nr:transporter substrate-binding domain-containing protein [Clostridia bacterium]